RALRAAPGRTGRLALRRAGGQHGRGRGRLRAIGLLREDRAVRIGRDARQEIIGRGVAARRHEGALDHAGTAARPEPVVHAHAHDIVLDVDALVREAGADHVGYAPAILKAWPDSTAVLA